MSERSLDASTSIAALSKRWLEAWSAGSAEAFGLCCTVAVAYEDPLVPEPLEGLESLAAHARQVRAAMPDMRLEQVGRPLADDAYACLPWRLVATHRGAIGGLPATGRFVTLSGVHYLELADGRIRRARGFFDLYGAATQLGLLPRRGSIGETALLLLRGWGLRPRA